MAETQPAAFFSYVHADNEGTDGAVIAMADAIKNEFAFLTGEDLLLFVDTDLEWGEDWRARLEGEVDGATFFLPVMTPRYFGRPECRKELKDFTDKAEEIGVTDFVLPVLFGDIDGYGEESEDPLVALTARLQWQSFVEERLAGKASEAYRRRINAMARRLRAVTSQLEARREEGAIADELPDLAKDLATAEDTTPPSLAELRTNLEAILPFWQSAYQEDGVNHSTHDYVDRLYVRAKIRARTHRSTRFAVEQRFAMEFLVLAKKHREKMEDFLRLSRELGEQVNGVVALVNEHPELSGEFGELVEAIEARWDLMIAAHERNVGRENADLSRRFLSAQGHLSRHFAEAGRLHEEADAFSRESRSLVAGWEEQLQELGMLKRTEIVKEIYGEEG